MTHFHPDRQGGERPELISDKIKGKGHISQISQFLLENRSLEISSGDRAGCSANFLLLSNKSQPRD